MPTAEPQVAGHRARPTPLPPPAAGTGRAGPRESARPPRRAPSPNPTPTPRRVPVPPPCNPLETASPRLIPGLGLVSTNLETYKINEEQTASCWCENTIGTVQQAKLHYRVLHRDMHFAKV
ncbi:hypothetical protein TRIUR3_06955 [Triticum urartu]|uniref:Uncharacterized protein n=1 Tax=Triticum urartu TaxID=4572 RepID=M7Z0Q5_TRIUA|nr:hypothetical protein TRIUR3_06955 [Triticum urartu]